MSNKEKFDVIVVGGGPAGMNLAGILADTKRVCLIDHKSDLASVSFHTLGSFLDPTEYGLSGEIVASHVTEVGFHSKHISTIKKGSAYILNKSQIHRELLDRAVAKSVYLKTETSIRDFHRNTDGVIDYVIDARGNTYCADIFVDASGVAGFFSKKLDLQDVKSKIAVGLEYNVRYKDPQHRAHLFIGRNFMGGYGWIFPLGRSRAIFGYGTIGFNGTLNSKEKIDAVCSLPLVRTLIEKDNEVMYGGTIPITGVKAKFVYKNVVCVGDSVSQVHPLVGEGYRFVLASGKIAAPYILTALETGDIRKLSEYEEEWRNKFYASYRRGKRGQKIMYAASKSDLLSDAAALILKTIPDSKFQELLSG